MITEKQADTIIALLSDIKENTANIDTNYNDLDVILEEMKEARKETKSSFESIRDSLNEVVNGLDRLG